MTTFFLCQINYIQKITMLTLLDIINLSKSLTDVMLLAMAAII